MATEKRSRFFVDPKVQGGIVCRVVLYWMALIVLMGTMAGVMAVSQTEGAAIDVVLGRVAVAMGPSLIAALLVLPALVFDTIRYTHRSVGPIVRLHNELARLAAGEEVKELTFRKNDHWKGLATRFNNVADEMKRLREAEAQRETAPGSTVAS